MSMAVIDNERIKERVGEKGAEEGWRSGNTNWRGRLSTIDLLVLTNLDQLLLYIFYFLTTWIILMRRSSTEPSLSVSFPWEGGKESEWVVVQR
jgi:hypothetical protein